MPISIHYPRAESSSIKYTNSAEEFSKGLSIIVFPLILIMDVFFEYIVYYPVF